MTEVQFSYSDETQPLLKRKTIQLIEKATGQPLLYGLYRENQKNPVPGESFWQAAVRQLQVIPTFKADSLANIPASGPVVIVANHPYGVLDGLVMCWLIEKVRKDFLVLTHSLLLRAPEARSNLLPVDFTGTREAFETNLGSREAARQHLAKGGCIVVFPAGAVSTTPDKLGRKPAIDWPWQPFTAQLIQRSKATVVPIFFSGQNSRLFQIASHISPTLRLSLIFKEVHDRIGTELPLVIGAPISPETHGQYKDRQALLGYLRDATYALERDVKADSGNVLPFKGPKKAEKVVHSVKSFIRKLETRRMLRERLRKSA
jgi:putative hemolysin